MTISIKHEDVTYDLVTTTVVCEEHGEVIYTIYPNIAAQIALSHRMKYPFCGEIRHAVDDCLLIR